MSAVMDAQKILQSSGLEQLELIYASNIPKEMQNNTDKTIVLITDVGMRLDLDGNDTFHGAEREVEIQLFYKLDIDFDLDSFEFALLKLFRNNHWSIADIREHTVDPDTLQVTWVFYVVEHKILN